jgi:hypothetical protein
MPAVTPSPGFAPYPLPTDPVANGAVAMQNLALATDNKAWAARAATTIDAATSTWRELVRLNVPDAPIGRYLVIFNLAWSANWNAVAKTYIRISDAGAVIPNTQFQLAGYSPGDPVMVLSPLMILWTTTKVGFDLRGDYGFATYNVRGYASATTLTAIRLGPAS